MSITDLTDDLFAFIDDNCDKDAGTLLLSSKKHDYNFDIRFAALQIECRRKYKKKLPAFCSNKLTVFPTSLSAEQSTSECLADFHSSLIEDGASVLDLTSGLSIDSFAFCRYAGMVVGVERDKLISELASYNASVLGIDNYVGVCADSSEYLNNLTECFNTVFIDPARRKADSSRAYDFADCSPDIIGLWDKISEISETIIIKASPMLDIHRVYDQIPSATDIYVNSIEGECKEILVVVRRAAVRNLVLHAVEFKNDGKLLYHYEYKCIKGLEHDIRYLVDSVIPDGMYLYIPNSNIMKIQPWNDLSLKYPGLMKLHPNSHVFVSGKNINDFPGRKFIVEGVFSMKSKEVKAFKGEKMNVMSKNYPLSVRQVRSKLKINDGGESYLLCTTLYNGDKKLIFLRKSVKD